MSWWPGDGNADDIWGGHNGSILGGMGFAPGMVGQAFDLDNVDDGVEVPNTGGVFDLVNEWTLDAWVFPNAPGSDPIVWKTSSGANQDTFGLGWSVDSRFFTKLERASDDQDFGIASLFHLPARWYHVAGVYDGTDLILYVDGVEDARRTIGSVVAYTSPAPLRIGNIIGSGHGNAGVFDGLIDEAGVYIRALEASEIQAIYDAGSAGKCKGNLSPDCSEAAPVLGELWPPNHEFREVSIEGVTDPDGDPITITDILQDERLDAPGSGNTCPDAAGVGTDVALLRSERSGRGNGRVYHVGFLAEDGQGGECTGAISVCQPHDQGQGSECVDEGPLYDSTGPCNPGNDADEDGLLDTQELAIGTHLLNPDSDCDGFSDPVKLAAGSNPKDADSTPDGAEAAEDTPIPALPLYFQFMLVGSIVAGGLVMRRRRRV